MIDYLERLFAVKPEKQEEQEDLSISRAVPEAEIQVQTVKIASEPGPEQEVSTKPARDVEFWQGEALRRIESALTVPEGERESLAIQRPASQRAGEGLERRLRRDSRCYDSGFYWY